MQMIGFAVWAAAAGALIPLMAIMNAGLARHVGHPVVAAAILFGVAFLATSALALATGARSFGDVGGAPAYQFAGGLIVATYVVSITMLAPRFGIGNAILFVMTAQILTSAAIDHFGLLGATVRPVTWLRLVGIALLLTGLAITQLSTTPQK